MENEKQSWEAEGSPVKISYSVAAMESMRQAAVVGLQKVPRRGLEIGGLLFGHHNGEVIEIEEWREIHCDHARGPGFDLSSADETRLEEMISDVRNDPHLSQFEIVGWFRTRTKGDLIISEADAAFADRFLPEPWQIVLVIRPHMYEPGQAGFFYRNEGGTLPTGSCPHEFKLENRGRRLPVGFDPSQGPQHTRGPKEAPAERPTGPVAGAPAYDPQSIPPRPGPEDVFAPVAAPQPVARKRLSPSPWFLNAVLAGLVIVISFIMFGLPILNSTGRNQFDLRVHDVGGQLMIEWDPPRKAESLAASATLKIVDGTREQAIELTPEELRGGNVVYQRRTGDVEVRLLLSGNGGEPVPVVARFRGEDAAPPPDSPVVEGASEEMKEQIERLKSQLEAETARAEQLRRQIEAEKSRLDIKN